MSWIVGNRYLSKSEMENNASIIYNTLKGRGWSTNAIAAILGNMESESTINPGVWENLDSSDISGGFGLVQWTPSTNYTNWANAKGYEITNGAGQLEWIDEQTIPKGQWISTTAYPLSFSEFKTSTQTPEYLASAFLKNFERAGVEVEAERRSQARTWYNYITNGNTEPDTPTPPPSSGGKRIRKKFNFLLFKRKAWNQR